MVNIYRIFHPTTRQYTFYSAGNGTFSKIDHILGQKASLNKFKKIKITPCIISEHNGIKQDLYKKKSPENTQIHRN
jgi:exonuclease III